MGMKIVPVIKNVSSDIKNTSVRISKAGVDGFNIGARKAKVYREGDIAAFTSITKSVGRKVRKQTTVDDLPIVAGAVGLFIPLPLISPIMFGLGLAVKYGVKILKK